MTLTIDELSVAIGKRPILNHLSFQAKQQQLTVLFGLNGTGKTTLLKTIVGLLKPTQGFITLDKQDLLTMPAKQRARHLAYIPQNTALPLDFTVFDFVLMGVAPQIQLFAAPTKQHRQRVTDILVTMALDTLATTPLNQLSGGQKQRVYLARALVQNASFMLLDEPIAYLDYQRQHQFFEQLQTLLHQQAKGALVTLHDPNMALQYADHIVIIDQQTVMADIDCHAPKYSLHFQEALSTLYHHPIKLITDKHHQLLIWT